MPPHKTVVLDVVALTRGLISEENTPFLAQYIQQQQGGGELSKVRQRCLGAYVLFAAILCPRTTAAGPTDAVAFCNKPIAGFRRGLRR